MARTIRIEYGPPINEFGDVMRVRITREKNRVLDFVVQYEALVDEVFRPAVRHDGSHGVPHRDLLAWSGATIEKRWDAEAATMNDALSDAIRDIQANWEYFRAEFLRRRP